MTQSDAVFTKHLHIIFSLKNLSSALIRPATSIIAIGNVASYCAPTILLGAPVSRACRCAALRRAHAPHPCPGGAARDARRTPSVTFPPTSSSNPARWGNGDSSESPPRKSRTQSQTQGSRGNASTCRGRGAQIAAGTARRTALRAHRGAGTARGGGTSSIWFWAWDRPRACTSVGSAVEVMCVCVCERSRRTRARSLRGDQKPGSTVTCHLECNLTVLPAQMPAHALYTKGSWNAAGCSECIVGRHILLSRTAIYLPHGINNHISPAAARS